MVGITYFTPISKGAVKANKVKKIPTKTATKVLDLMETIATMTVVIRLSKITERIDKIDFSTKIELEGKKLESTPNLGNIMP